jgi:hypothetical protein
MLHLALHLPLVSLLLLADFAELALDGAELLEEVSDRETGEIAGRGAL